MVCNDWGQFDWRRASLSPTGRVAATPRGWVRAARWQVLGASRPSGKVPGRNFRREGRWPL